MRGAIVRLRPTARSPLDALSARPIVISGFEG